MEWTSGHCGSMMVAVDYLGRWEVEEGMETAMDVMRDLIRRGVRQEYFIPNAVLEIQEDEIELLDRTDGVKLTTLSS